MLLEAGAVVNAEDGFPLIAAAEQGHEDTVRLLLEHRAEVNLQTELHPSRTALQAACDFGRTNVVKLLLVHGADVNLGGGINSFPIFGAISQLNQELLEVLLASGRVNLSVEGGLHRTRPLHYAAMRSPVQAVETLIKAGADVNEPDSDGDTALIAAALSGDWECVRLFLESGADFLATNSSNETALQLALERGYTTCVELLGNRATALLKRFNEEAKRGNGKIAFLKNEELRQRREAMQAEAAEKKAREEMMNKEMREGEGAPIAQSDTVQNGGEQIQAEEEVSRNDATQHGEDVPEEEVEEQHNLDVDMGDAHAYATGRGGGETSLPFRNRQNSLAQANEHGVGWKNREEDVEEGEGLDEDDERETEEEDSEDNVHHSEEEGSVG